MDKSVFKRSPGTAAFGLLLLAFAYWLSRVSGDLFFFFGISFFALPITIQGVLSCLHPKKFGKPISFTCNKEETFILGCFMVFVCVGVLAFGTIWIVGWIKSPKRIHVNSQDLGSDWPLTKSEGYIYKRDEKYGRVSVFFEDLDGNKFALNGTAISSGYENIHTITKQSPDLFGEPRYADVDNLIAIGLRGNAHK